MDDRCTSMWRRWIRLSAVFAIVAGSLGCDGGCETEGFEEVPFPEQHADETLERGAEVRVSSHGLQFVEEEMVNLAEEMLGDEETAGEGDLGFCIPPTEDEDGDDDFEICHEEGVTCADGSEGCQVDLTLEEVSIDAHPPDELVVELTIGDLFKEEEIPVTAADPVFGVELDCWLDLHAEGNDSQPAEIPVTATVSFEVDDNSPFGDIGVDLADVNVDIDGVGYDLNNRDGFGCNAASYVVDWFLDDMLRDELEEEVDEFVEDLRREQLCRGCDDQFGCPNDADCDEGDDPPVCMYGEDDCVPTLLGIEGIIILEELLEDYLPGEASDVYTTARVADHADVDSGLTLGVRAGAEPRVDTLCAPVDRDERPSFDPPAPAEALSQDYTPEGEQYMLGLAVHERTFQHVLWSVWASGGLCAEIGYEDVDMLTTSTLGVALDSVDALATDTAPAAIRLTPQQPPDVRIGDNVVDDGEVVDGLLTLVWDDLDVHVYGFVHERYARLFTLRVDVELPIAAVPDGEGLHPVFGDFEDALENLRVRDDELIDEDDETFEELIDLLMSFAVPELTDAFDEPLELPEMFGYRVDIDQQDFGALEDGEYLGLFASLEFVGDDDDAGQIRRPPVRAQVSQQEMVVEDHGGALPQVTVKLDVDATAGGAALPGEEVEYLYRIDSGGWRVAGTGPQLVLDHPRFAAQGEHHVELRARRLAEGARWQRAPTELTVRVDYEPPRLEAWRDGDEIAVDAVDAVDSVEQLQLRHRFVVDDAPKEWSEWSDVDSVALDDAPEADELNVDVQVRDRAGFVAEQTVDISPPADDDPPPTLRASAEDEPDETGCSAAGGATPAGIAVMVAVLALVALRRRRRLVVAAGLVSVVVLVATGCSDEAADSEQQEGCDGCPTGEVCVDDECVPPACDERSDCDADEMDCPDGDVAVCDNGECSCALACDGGCESDEFCCHLDNACQSLPDPCEGHDCQDGYESHLDEEPSYDEHSCQVDDGACVCEPMGEIGVRYHGAYPSADFGGGVGAIAVYNVSYGDLMVGELDGDHIERWHIVDGMPEDGSVGGDPHGFRDGVTTLGDDVGTHTATAVDDNGRIHVFYRHEGDEALRYARGVDEGAGFQFDTTTIEGGDTDAGYYTEVVLRDGMLELLYTSRVGEEDRSEIRHRSIDVAEPVDAIGEDYEVVHSGQREPAELADYPRVAGLFLQGGETEDARLFVSFYDNTRQQVGWLQEGEDGWEEATLLDIEDAGPYATARPGDGGQVHLAYMTRSRMTLEYRDVDLDDIDTDVDAEVVVDGIRDHDGAFSRSPVGHDVRLHLDGEDAELLYHDASGHELRRVTRSGDGDWHAETLAGQAGAPTPAHGLYVTTTSDGGDRLVVDFSVDTTGDDDVVAEPAIRAVD